LQDAAAGAPPRAVVRDVDAPDAIAGVIEDEEDPDARACRAPPRHAALPQHCCAAAAAAYGPAERR
jgi:hypothetical protein